ncbi:DUF3626 domain-containing protein [Streptomyces sp. NBC_00059]|uniref:DUF3626 domain-containing protein n=1 Tax=Streptomyces sp. NBC_00059 TaxID=2975635 RepID=UPI00224EA250|nr:DUF3626 domain-containing protein [Streptomyces sp. NBC_00059]MCX5417509.1 DUF3626 domain-containing protein [Streptomyces sp. NBC_00059]
MSADLPPARARALSHVAAMSTGTPLDPSLRVTLNFHPDRVSGGRTVLERLAEDGVYVSQFVTGTGNGGLTAHPGGDRWRWESRIFGGAYDGASAHERPVYGALDFRRAPFGAAPRFGSAHLRLTAEALPRSTFCYPDSFLEPSDFGVAAAGSRLIALAEADARDALDDYVEAHVHGPVRLKDHAEALVLDPCFRGTDVEKAARALPCPLEWHGGFRLGTDELRRHPEYRGPEYVELGSGIAVDGFLDARIIGEAVAAGRHDPQDLKRVWHCVARFGRSM